MITKANLAYSHKMIILGALPSDRRLARDEQSGWHLGFPVNDFIFVSVITHKERVKTGFLTLGRLCKPVQILS
jgi:hypothetical protein